jgi:hypothetical protein
MEAPVTYDEAIEKMAEALEPAWFSENAHIIESTTGGAQRQRERARLKARAAAEAIGLRQMMTLHGACQMIADHLGHEFIGPNGRRYETTEARDTPVTF